MQEVLLALRFEKDVFNRVHLSQDAVNVQEVLLALRFEFAYEADEGVVDFISLLVLRFLDEAMGVADQVLLVGDKFAARDGSV